MWTFVGSCSSWHRALETPIISSDLHTTERGVTAFKALVSSHNLPMWPVFGHSPTSPVRVVPGQPPLQPPLVLEPQLRPRLPLLARPRPLRAPQRGQHSALQPSTSQYRCTSHMIKIGQIFLCFKYFSVNFYECFIMLQIF